MYVITYSYIENNVVETEVISGVVNTMEEVNRTIEEFLRDTLMINDMKVYDGVYEVPFEDGTKGLIKSHALY